MTTSDAMNHPGQDCKNSASDEAEEDEEDEEHNKDGIDNSVLD